jgi:hypothetical protein
MYMKLYDQPSLPSKTQWPAVRMIEYPLPVEGSLTTLPEQIQLEPPDAKRMRPDRSGSLRQAPRGSGDVAGPATAARLGVGHKLAGSIAHESLGFARQFAPASSRR